MVTCGKHLLKARVGVINVVDVSVQVKCKELDEGPPIGGKFGASP